MKRPAICFLVWVALVGWAATSHAKKGAGGGKAAAPATSEAAGGDDNAKAGGADTAGSDEKAGGAKAEGGGGGKEAGAASESLEGDETQPAKVEEEVSGPKAARPGGTGSWADIVVVPRKPFLKSGRLEIAPFSGITVNDNLIRHYIFGADLNFFLSDIFWVGLQGQYYIHELTNQEELVGSEYNRAPTLNQYLYGGSLNLGYAPVYGKFALFNRSIVGWEIWISGGIGLTFTEVIPRDPANASLAFKNTDFTPNVGIGGRLFVLNWLTINIGFRDYITPDHFEPLPDGPPNIMSSAQAKDHSQSEWVQNMVLYAGVGFYLPTKFQYKTPR